MCEEKMSFRLITTESPEKAEAEAIYNEAFPERERPYSFDELLRVAKESGIFKMTMVVSGDKTIGIACYADCGRYAYLMYFAINNALRGGGYGSKLIRTFLEFCGDKPVVGGIETPIPGTPNYTQREKRRVFYERSGMFMTKYSYGLRNNPESMITMISTRPEDGAFEIFIDLTKLLMRWLPAPSMDKSELRLFVTENGRTEELPLTINDLMAGIESGK